MKIYSDEDTVPDSRSVSTSDNKFTDKIITPFDDLFINKESFRGKSLKNAFLAEKSFPRLRYRLRKPFSRSPYMNQFENNILLTTDFHCVGREAELIYNSIMALLTFYIKNNAVNWFKCHLQIQNKIKVSLLSIASKYYGDALSHLRWYLTDKDSNVSTSIIVSSYLNKLAIYEFKDPSHSLAFTNGTAGIFNTALQNPSGYNKQEFAWIINYLDIAYKTDFFPSYSYQTLQEFSEYVELYEHNIIPHEFEDKQTVIQQLNNLKAFLADFHKITKTHLVNEMRNDYNLVYTLLRNLLRILPDEVMLIKHQRKKVMKHILMLLYEALTRLLESIIPNCYHLFFQGFKEGIKLWNTPDYVTIPIENIPEDLERVEQYSIRISSFFQKRFNFLSTFFGDQQFTDQPVTSEMISACIAEVMIERFTDTAIGYVNLVHFPLVSKFLKEDENIAHNLANIEKFEIYQYNQHLYKYIKTDLTSRQQLVEHDYILNSDPILNSHLINTTATSKDTKKKPAQNEFEEWATKVNYYAKLEPELAHQATDWISRDYSRCLLKGQFWIPDDDGKLNYKTSLNYNDQDVIISVRNPMQILTKTEKLTKNELANILNQFYKRRVWVFHPLNQQQP